MSSEDIVKEFNLKELTTENEFVKLAPTEFQELVKRKIIQVEKNITKEDLSKPFFILYELIPDEKTALCLYDIVQLQIIKMFLKQAKNHLIIQIADEEVFAYTKKQFSQIHKNALEKLKSVISYLIEEAPELEKQIHVFYNRELHLHNRIYEEKVSFYKMKVTYDKIKSLFSLTEEDNINKLDYPCYTAVASNGEIYTNYIPEITKDTKCIIINQINKINRYELCFDASEKLQFTKPGFIGFKIVPQLNGKDEDCYVDDEHTMLSTDDDKSLRKKIMKFSFSGSRGSGNLEDHRKLGGDVESDISCRCLRFIEFDNAKLDENIEKFSKGILTCGEIKEVLYEKVVKIFNGIKKNFPKEVEGFFLKKN